MRIDDHSNNGKVEKSYREHGYSFDLTLVLHVSVLLVNINENKPPCSILKPLPDVLQLVLHVVLLQIPQMVTEAIVTRPKSAALLIARLIGLAHLLVDLLGFHVIYLNNLRGVTLGYKVHVGQRALFYHARGD